MYVRTVWEVIHAENNPENYTPTLGVCVGGGGGVKNGEGSRKVRVKIKN